MCDPTAIGLSMAGLQYLGRSAEIDVQNQQAKQNRVNAVEAGNQEIATTTAQYVENNRSLIQAGFDAVLEGRAEEALAYTSAVESGVQGKSVKAVLRSSKQKTGRTLTRTAQEQRSLKDQTGFNYDGIVAKTQDRINSVAPTRWNIGDTVQVLSPIVRSQME